MSVVVLSRDADAARLLCSALKRAGQPVQWEETVPAATAATRSSPPLVLVVDSEVPGHGDVVDAVRRHAPWARVYALGDDHGRSEVDGRDAHIVRKPFDASELAQQIEHDSQIADRERGRQHVESRATDLSLLVEASLEAIVGLDSAGRILSWNHGAEVIYGYAAGDVLGRNIDLLDDGSAPPRGVALGLLETRRQRKDGREISVLISRSPIAESQSNLAFAEVSLDVTERRRLERELEHAERLATIGRLAASMAHEINNPLSVIRANLPLVSQVAARVGDTELVGAALDIEDATLRIASFVTHVCGFARRSPTQLTDAPLSESIEIALRMTRPRAKERGVQVDVAGNLDVRVRHDRARFPQAVLNVLANAIDAAAQRGKHVTLSLTTEPGEAHVHVDDDGPGIAPEIAARLFEPFATTKPHGEGTGLGLAITHQIVQDHGGRIVLGARPTGGTRATITLSRTDPRAVRVVVLADAASHAVHALTQEGFQVTHVTTPAEVRKALGEQRVHVLVVARAVDALDELLIGVRSASPDVRQLVVGGDPELSVVGADAVIGHAPDPRKIVDEVRQLVVSEGSEPPPR